VSSEEENNKALVRRFVEELDKGNLDVIDELLAPDFVDRSLLPGQEPDRESFKRSVAEMQAPFSDTNITIDEQVAEGDKVVTWYTASSTHDRGPLMGIPPTGRRTTFTGVYLHRIVGGKIVEEPGESVLFYTDGLIEAHNSRGEMFGTPRLRSLLSERFESGRGLSAILLDELERFTGERWEQEDDITLLTLRRSAGLR
jgi:predicted ester cyclase